MWSISRLFWKQKPPKEAEAAVGPDYFAKLPLKMQEQIFKETDTKSRLSLAKLSYNFHKFVEKSEMTYESLSLIASNSRVAVVFNDGLETRKRHFEPHEQGYIMKNPANNWEKANKDGDYRKAAVAFFLAIFKHSKVTIEKLEIRVDLDPIEAPSLWCQLPWTGRRSSRFPFERFAEDHKVLIDELHRILESKGFQLSVNCLTMSMDIDQDDLLKVLPYLKPRVLETIALHHPDWPIRVDYQTIQLDRIAETQQWKEAKNYAGSVKLCSLSFAKWAHFETVEILINNVDAKIWQIWKKFFENPNFRSCSIVFLGTVNMEFLDVFIDTNFTITEEVGYLRRWNSKIFYIYFDGKVMIMCKVGKEEFERLKLSRGIPHPTHSLSCSRIFSF